MNAIEIEMDGIEIAFDESPVSAPPQAREQPSRAREIPPSRRPEEPMTLFWSHEIECSFVSTLWHAPQYLALAQHELDLKAHFSVTPYRKILEAIVLVHSEIGVDLDFTCVVHCVREMGVFEECGGLLGLDQVYTDNNHYPEGRAHPEPIIREYIRLLKEYAIARKTDPFQSVRHYTRGRGFLQRNKLATRPEHPAVIGKIERCCCGRRCMIAGWPGEGGNLNLTLTPER